MEPQGEQFKQLVKIFFELMEAQDIDRLMEILLDGALSLVNAEHGSIYRLDYRTGQMKVVHSRPNGALLLADKEWGEGVIGFALKNYEVQSIPDVTVGHWSKIYVTDWDGMGSEIALPIIRDNIPVRIKTEVSKKGTKKIGVLNIESKDKNAFNDEQVDLLTHLVQFAAIIIENLESDMKLAQLRNVEKEIADSSKDYEQIIDLVIKSIIDILIFDIVNVSIVDFENNTISSRYIKGVPEDKKEDFLQRASHSLNSNDIQAHIVRDKKIEVPEYDDERLDKPLADDFNHKKLVRVFIPMIESANGLAIGSVECGYEREYREFIYERDVQILETFVSKATEALEQRKKSSLEVIAHELRNPILGIRNHADRLLRKWKSGLRDDQIDAKLEDIETDAEILFYQVRQLEAIMGTNTYPSLKIEEVYISNEITKVFSQLRRETRARGFSTSGLEYQFDDQTKKIVILTDRARLNQIIYNLLLNSIKYAEEDKDKFKIRIKIEKNRHRPNELRVRFQDYGVGIREEEKDEIFKPGFRGSETKNREQGAGVGLSVCKDLITKIGGDIILFSLKQPTEFQLVIPYLLKPS
jgi:signal transduction histidine kinase/putative methionine-R-sulfoxide reductase with GAF domain